MEPSRQCRVDEKRNAFVTSVNPGAETTYRSCLIRMSDTRPSWKVTGLPVSLKNAEATGTILPIWLLR